MRPSSHLKKEQKEHISKCGELTVEFIAILQLLYTAPHVDLRGHDADKVNLVGKLTLRSRIELWDFVNQSSEDGYSNG